MTAASARKREAEEIRSTLTTVLNGLENEDQAIRSIRGLIHTRSFSTASTLRASMVQSAPSVFSVKCHRRFNQDIQGVCFDEKLDAFGKMEKITSMIRDFEREAGAMAQEFLENYLGDDPSEIRWAEKEEAAYGECLNITILDGDDNSIAIARQEQKMQYLFLSQQLGHMNHPLICVSPRTIVSYRGRAMLVASEVGPAYANAQGDFSKIPELKIALSYMNECCNLRRFGNLRENGKEERVSGPVGTTAFRGTDGRYYIQNLCGLMPRFPPARGSNPNSRECGVFLREEAVASFHVPLSPGAFVCYGCKDSAQGAQEVRTCAEQLCQVGVVELAKSLQAKGPKSCQQIVQEAHTHGVNVALLGLLYHHIESTSPLKGLVLTEMTSRVARDHIRAVMSTRIEEDEIRSAISEFCAAFCNDDTVATLWQDELVPRLVKKFVGFATLIAPKGVNFSSVNKQVLLNRLEDLIGFKFAKGTTPKGTTAFHFTIESLGSVIKQFALPLFRVGSSIYMSPGMTSPSLNPSGETGPRTEILRARIGAVAYPAEESVAEFLNKRKVASGPNSSEYVHSCYEASFLLSRAGQIDAAMNYVEQALSISNSSNSLRKSFLIGMIRGQRGMLHALKGNFGTAVSDLDAASKILSHPKFSADERAESPKSMDSLALGGSVGFFPREAVSAPGAAFCKDLAQIYEDRGLKEEAEPLYRSCLESSKMILGRVHPSVSMALNNLAVNLFSQEQYKEAEELYLEDLDISEKLHGTQDLAVANSLNNLACLYDKLERFEESEKMYLRDIEISTSVLGAKHPDVATSRNNLASSYFQQGRLAEAEKEYAIALEMRKAYFGEQHVTVGESLNNIAALQRKQGKLQAANDTWKKSLAVYERCCGSTHHSLAPILDNMQSLAEEMGDVDAAEEFMERLMELKRAENEAFTAQQSAVGNK